uniref:Chitobiosyldiphosphodolichol beta-mannosyltransferase n=1 Tax=Nothobranchius furzeri TaxID=105023 RepID=A0A8C6NV80_NOTFU
MEYRGSLVIISTCLVLLVSCFLADLDVTLPVMYVTVAAVLWLCWGWLRRRDGGTHQRVCVLVLGDIGRSPRMQYHALSLSKHGYQVTLVGFLGESPKHTWRQNSAAFPAGPKLLTYAVKVVVQSLQLLRLLLTMKLQNPPGLPGIAVAWLVCALRGTTFIIDWHNYGYTIMALSLGAAHPVVRLAKWYEHLFGRLSTLNLCVTNAMKNDLQKNWGIEATALHDRPASVFGKTSLNLQHELFCRLANTYPEFQTVGEETKAEATVFTVCSPNDGSVTLWRDRPALLVSSTSWTEDEDFSILLKALEEYEGYIRGGSLLPSLVCVITGKGPQKEHYRKLIDSLHLDHVNICTPWLEAEDYPLLLGSSDLGVCLHKSSSGLDLPMKVVDMFGCCLPVCAISFNSLPELVKHDENGLIFRDSAELAEQLKSLLSGFPSLDGKLGAFRAKLCSSRDQCWDDNWDQTVLPLLRSLSLPEP